jgi:hypothetical protein
MDRRRLARRNLAIFWMVLLGIPLALGSVVAIWASLAMPSYMS